MTRRDENFHVRPGRIRHDNQGARAPKSFVGEVMRAAKKAGHIGQSFGRSRAGASRSRFGRGRRAAFSLSLQSTSRRVVMKARGARHQGTRVRSAPLPKHITYLKPERVTLELGPRTEQEIRSSLEREVDAERWTGLARALRNIADEGGGVADLRPGPSNDDPELRRLMLGRAKKLQRLGLADQIGPASWTLKPGLEQSLRELSIRGDIIKTMHQALTVTGREPDVAGFALHGDAAATPVLGRLVARGLHDELKGSAYPIVDGVHS